MRFIRETTLAGVFLMILIISWFLFSSSFLDVLLVLLLLLLLPLMLMYKMA